jgi:CubicO group peptidase (beta-lactamase class C family)
LKRPAQPTVIPVAALLLACSALALGGLSSFARGDAIDDYLQRELATRQIPGLALAVVRHGNVERISAYGLANIETGTPVSADSIFAIASLDKGITATGVMKAMEQGKLSVADPITKYVDVPLPSVTLGMLLSHTAGLPDMDQALAEHYGAHLFQHYSTDELLVAVRNARPVGAPGTRYYYSDAGFFLAQLATQKAVGQPWFAWMQKTLFRPAGMQNVVTMHPTAIIAHRVAPYTFDSGQHLIRDGRTEVDYDLMYNDIGMTVGDFARWLIMLDGRGPLSAASVKRLWTQVTLADGFPTREVYAFSGYGMGFGLDDVLGEPVILHTGHSGVAYVKFPRLDLAVVVFTNLEHPMGSDPAGMALEVAGLLEPRVSLAALPAGNAHEPVAAKGLRHDYELFVAGTPDLAHYAAQLRDAVWLNRDTFSGRLPRLGGLKSWQFLREAPVDGDRSLLFRATHAHGVVYVRLSLDHAGLVTRLVWWHL